MISSPYTFECITPCFCAGENQAMAEIRPSAIRGALRWWLRALGGSRAAENEVFGGADPIKASSLLVRTSDVARKPVGHLHQPQGVDPLSYILYFPSVSSGKTRWNEAACFGPGTTFQLHVRQLRDISPDASELFQNALLAFRHYGSIGMHITRGLGAVQDINTTPESWQTVNGLLTQRGFTIRQATPKPDNKWDSVLKEAGQWLQNDLRKEFGAGGNKKPAQATALGSAMPVRQTSAVYLRPVKQNGNLIFAAFEAPHARVLGAASKGKHNAPVLQTRDFTQTPPSPQRQGDRRR
jgi:CRISPR type III-B/RAMP module RAMP protein Cmr1